jgi:hypothetical protein
MALQIELQRGRACDLQGPEQASPPFPGEVTSGYFTGEKCSSRLAERRLYCTPLFPKHMIPDRFETLGILVHIQPVTLAAAVGFSEHWGLTVRCS